MADRSDPEIRKQMKLKYDSMVSPESKKKTLPTETGVLSMDAIQKMFTQFMSQLSTSTVMRP